MSVHDQWAKQHRGLVFTAFALLAMVGLAATIVQSEQSAKQNAESSLKLTHNLQSLSSATSEAARLQSLNTDLTKQLLASNRNITALANQAISTTTGGESFAYLYFVSPPEAGPEATTNLVGSARYGFPAIVQQGKFPLYQLQARITDVKLYEPPKRTQVPVFALSTGLGMPIEISSLAPGLSSYAWGQKIDFEDREHLSYVIQFYALNGAWFELLRLDKADGKWAQSISISFSGKKRKQWNLTK